MLKFTPSFWLRNTVYFLKNIIRFFPLIQFYPIYEKPRIEFFYFLNSQIAYLRSP